MQPQKKYPKVQKGGKIWFADRAISENGGFLQFSGMQPKGFGGNIGSSDKYLNLKKKHTKDEHWTLSLRVQLRACEASNNDYDASL